MSKITLVEVAAPATPDSGKVALYAKSDGLLYSKDDAGAETLVSGGSGGGGTMDDFTVAADSGTPETVADGNTLTLAGGTGIDTVVSATDTVTIAIDSTVATLSGAQTLANKILSQLQLIIGGFKAIFTHANSADRTYTLPNYDGTLATVAGTETFTNKTLTTPTIASFTNATHNHSNAAGGGTIDASVLTYTPAVNADWNGSADPGDVDNALDQLAERVKDLEGAGGGGLYTSVAILRDEKTSATQSGASAATTWNNRDLNTEVYDPDGIVSIASNQFTPIAGAYEIFVRAAAHGSVGFHRLRVYNVTGAASVDEGMNNRGGTASEGDEATITTQFTTNGTDAYRIDHYTQSIVATNGFGAAMALGVNEVYMEIILRKLA